MTADSWKSRAAKRRDARATKTDAVPAHRSSKSTKKWCRGKVGVEHEPKCVDYATAKNARPDIYQGWKILICTKCGKELDYFYPMRGIDREPPEWAK